MLAKQRASPAKSSAVVARSWSSCVRSINPVNVATSAKHLKTLAVLWFLC